MAVAFIEDFDGIHERIVKHWLEREHQLSLSIGSKPLEGLHQRQVTASVEYVEIVKQRNVIAVNAEQPIVGAATTLVARSEVGLRETQGYGIAARRDWNLIAEMTEALGLI